MGLDPSVRNSSGQVSRRMPKGVDLKSGETLSSRPGSGTGPGTIQINRSDQPPIKIRY